MDFKELLKTKIEEAELYKEGLKIALELYAQWEKEHPNAPDIESETIEYYENQSERY